MMDDSEEEEIINAIWTNEPDEQISFSVNRIIRPTRSSEESDNWQLKLQQTSSKVLKHPML
jgi:hypothetical protein